MTTDQLDIVAQILNWNHIYQIQDIRLDEITKNPLMGRGTARVENLLDAACEVVRTTTEWQSDIRATIPTISLATNLLGAQHVISVCSALRYGCAFEELSLTSMINLVDPSERELCWRWLAFGIFYPRSKRFADQFKLRKTKLLNSDSSATGMKAFASVLENPVAEFRRSDWPEEQGDLVDAVLVSVIEKGATVYSSANRFSKPLMMLAAQQELEILYSRYDEKRVCVAVAGVGLGWLQASHVKSVERDLEKYENHADARFDLVVGSSTSPVQMMATKPETRTFVETVGKYLRSLSMKGSKGFSIAMLLYCCKNLEHLDLGGCNLKFEA